MINHNNYFFSEETKENSIKLVEIFKYLHLCAEYDQDFIVRDRNRIFKSLLGNIDNKTISNMSPEELAKCFNKFKNDDSLLK